MSIEVIRISDRRRRGLVTDWEHWIKNLSNLYVRLTHRIGESPFLYHEVSTVGLFASAAAMSGFLPMNEYELTKMGANDKRKRVSGRADLWFDAGKRCYSFEFKRAWLAATPFNLRRSMQEAIDDTNCIHHDEYHYAAAGLTAPIRDVHREKSYRDFAMSKFVDMAYLIGDAKRNGAYVFFKIKE